ncbi:MAG: NUDIX hydrolase [Propionibacteriaceae bacterium]
MYFFCSRGHRHWGPVGAAGALLVAAGTAGSRVLLTLRSAEVHQGNTWSVPGGAIDPGDVDEHAAASREIKEELGLDVFDWPVLGWHRFECGGWSYSTMVAAAPTEVEVTALGWETDEVRWLTLDQVDELAAAERLHPSFAKSWPALRSAIDAKQLFPSDLSSA